MIERYLSNRFLILYFTPFSLGALSTFTFEPFNITLLNLVIFPLFFFFIVFINKKSKVIYRNKPYKINLFLFGLLFGFGFYLSGLSWISNSLTFDENFKVLIPFAIILIPLLLSLFTALTIIFVGPHLKFDFSSIIVFSASLAISDYIRAIILTGFPWNLWAYSTVNANEMLQVINVIGLYSYNLIVITFFTLPIIFFFKIDIIKKILATILIIFISISLYIYGNFEINKNKIILNEVSDKTFVKIVSPNFDLKYGLSLSEIEDRFKKLIRYSEPDKDRETFFIWPEGVFSGYSFNDILVFKNLFSNNFSKKHYIILGVNRLDQQSGNFYNSIIILNNQFEIIQNYNKRKLVPFGEFLPFENLFNKLGFKKITEGHGSFLKGRQNNNLKIEKLSVLPLICYEVIFTNLIQNSEEDTNLIINISEDAWFGNTIGPDQHFAKSIFRAIENNTFFLRSANKGVSAIIDNKGNIVKQLNRNEAGNIEFKVPLIKANKIKNDLIFYLLLITYLLIFLICKKKYVRK